MYDSVCAFLYAHEITSFEEGEANINESGDFELVNERSCITLRFADRDALDILLSNITQQFPNISYEETAHTDDYLNAWKSFSTKVEISKDIIIVPSWQEDEPSSHKIRISLDPGYAFGSGSHETTILCAREIESIMQTKGEKLSLLDVGCGSGILSIIGAKLGFSQIHGVDIDPSAIDASKENAEKNGVHDATFSTAQLDDIDIQFDIIVANILSSTLRELRSSIERRLKDGGILILSGILKEEVISIADYYKNFEFFITIMNEWACARGIKKSN